MRLIATYVILSIVFIGCHKKEVPIDPCNVLVDGVYQYPTEPPDSSLSSEEKKEYWNIPKEIIACITTEGLIYTCYNTNSAIFVSATNGYQPGYELVKKWNRGFDELEYRTDTPELLIEFYDSIEIPHSINYNLFVMEILMAQDSILKKLSNKLILRLLNLSLEYHAQRRNIFISDNIIYDGTIIIMGRLLYYYKYQPFINYIQKNDKISNFIIDGRHTYILSRTDADIIIQYTNEFINQLNIN